MAFKEKKIRVQDDREHPSLGLEEAYILGSNVERLRCAENYSTLKLSLVSKLSRPTVIKIQKGHPNVKLADIRKLADALDTTVIDLLTPHEHD